MKIVLCIKTPPLTEYEIGKRYEVYIVNDSDLMQCNVCYEDGTDSSFNLVSFNEYFIFV